MNRRNFLRAGSLLTIPMIFRGFSMSAISSLSPVKPPVFNDKILVLIQMDGGNDTLNTVIPIEKYSILNTLRPNIIIPENKILKLNDLVGIHPSMTGLKSLYDDGMLNVIRAAGYPNQNRSHFRSTDIWTSATDANVVEATGWLGRYFALDYPDYPDNYPNEDIDFPFAITLGSTSSETCQGQTANYSIAVSDPQNVDQLFEGEWDYMPGGCYGDELDYIRGVIRQSNVYSEIVSEAYSKGNNLSAKYDDSNKLSQSLKIVARLISGGLSTKVYVLRLGGFDTHSGQVDASDTTIGKHADLLYTLSDAIYSFQDDLNLLGLQQRVVGMTFSEFGRQIRSNASDGTDHGTAVDLFMFGACVNPGITGTNPDITEDEEGGNGMEMQNNFRQIYASILSDWFETDNDKVNNVLYGNFEKLDIINPCDPNSSYTANNNDGIDIYPNPVSDILNVSFENKNFNKIQIYNDIGKKLKTINKIESENLRISFKEFNPGIYFINFLDSYKTITKKVIKI
ncbi:MAG: DUF1501 domain-containing protein [Saprospiraceae bacterium]